jgi:DNA-binding NarL/FixJ family response regulator
VLALVAQGLSNAEIAATLVISTNTVRTHLHSLALKLEATSRARVVANARALGIREALALPAIAARQLRIPA